jgi:hypothetical protein
MSNNPDYETGIGVGEHLDSLAASDDDVLAACMPADMLASMRANEAKQRKMTAESVRRMMGN